MEIYNQLGHVYKFWRGIWLYKQSMRIFSNYILNQKILIPHRSIIIRKKFFLLCLHKIQIQGEKNIRNLNILVKIFLFIKEYFSLVKKYGTVKYWVVFEHILFTKAFSLIWCDFFNFDILAQNLYIYILTISFIGSKM